jgi:hypothetical protein
VSGRRALALRRFKEEAVLAHVGGAFPSLPLLRDVVLCYAGCLSAGGSERCGSTEDSTGRSTTGTGQVGWGGMCRINILVLLIYLDLYKP